MLFMSQCMHIPLVTILIVISINVLKLFSCGFLNYWAAIIELQYLLMHKYLSYECAHVRAHVCVPVGMRMHKI